MEETLHPRREDGSVETGAVPESVFLRPSSPPHGWEGGALTAGISYEDLFEAAPDAMLVVDGAGRIQLVNRQAEQLFGWERPELPGRDFETLIPERFRTRHLDYRSAYFANPQVRPMGSGLDLYALRKDGTEIPVEISLSPRRSPGPLAVICSVRDVTQQKQAARPVVTATEDTTIHEMADLMVQHWINRLPIIRDGRLVGIVARSDLVRALAQGTWR